MDSYIDSVDVDSAGLERIDVEIEQYRQYAESRRQVALRTYWRSRSPHALLHDDLERRVCLTALIKEDMGRRFSQGESPSVTEYLESFPELRETSGRVVSLVYEEYCLREERGEPLDVESFCDRYAPWKDSLKAQLGYHRLLSQAAGSTPPQPSFPKVGDWFEEFELLARIGRGGYSRVFLAADHSLGGKRVVLKVAVDRGREAEAQGALDHPHIVPVNSVSFRDEGDFRGLSMPYRPGLPLDEVIRRLREDGRQPTSASELWDALAAGLRDSDTPIDGDLANALEKGPDSDGWRGYPVDGSFARGVAWIGMVLARALAYAHDHRTYHRDVKPGNVLLTVQHGPQLLDFNLAQSPHSANEAESAFQGGTLPYMAPEQIEAFLTPSRWADVAAPADVYSLGLVLRELLTGEPLDGPDRKLLTPRALQTLLDRRLCVASDVRRYAPKTPHGLEAIIKKCLQFDQSERYSSARQLAEDLERFLQRRPLLHVVNPSRAERARDWAARNRRLIVANAIYLTLFALISPLLLRQAYLLLLPDLKNQSEFHRAVASVDAGNFMEAIATLKKLAALYPTSPLVHYYLGFARDGIGTALPSPAQFDYAAAMKLPRAHEELRTWAGSHKATVPRLLLSFGNSRLVHYGRETQWNQDMTPEQRAPLMEELQTAADAFQMALELSPKTFDALKDDTPDPAAHKAALKPDELKADALKGLATIHEIREDAEKAYESLTTALEMSARHLNSEDPLRVASIRTQRCRVSTARARKVLNGDAQAQGRALEMLNEALTDLNIADALSGGVNQAYRPGCRAEALLTRGQLHHQLGNVEQVREDCREAKKALDRWIDLASAEGNPISKVVERVYRRRHYDLQRLIPAEVSALD